MTGLHSKSLSQPPPLPTSDFNPADEPPPYHHPQPHPSATAPPPTTPALPIGAQAVPDHNPGCNYNSQDGVTAQDHFATCLITGLRKAAQKAANFDKLHNIRRHASVSTTHRQPPGPCFKCGNKGHWARECPNPRPPKRPCPKCQQSGHWATDCPSSLGGDGPDPILKPISLSWQPTTDGALGPLPDTHHHHAGAQGASCDF
ncbi:uncharacterized protein [Symphalangus syndactylus]|uniref:uncharacterized protein n=1 Tax=Symphalangus syndactylus TaxID=9590 RepID=UPI00244173C4|nr:uncharacterized protein LOC129490404 [Symphalangus syndactylus]